MEQGSDKAQCGGGILCADVDGLAVDDGAHCADDPLGDPTVALRGSHHCRIGSTTGNYVEYRVVPYQAVSASRI